MAEIYCLRYQSKIISFLSKILILGTEDTRDKKGGLSLQILYKALSSRTEVLPDSLSPYSSSTVPYILTDLSPSSHTFLSDS